MQNSVDEVREAAIAAAAAGATWQWKERALQTIQEVARQKEEFTSEDIWDAGLDLDGAGEGDALGPVLRYAAKLGFITRTGKWDEQTKRPQRHNNPKRVWASKIVS